MPRALSYNTELVYWWAWRLPWASAADIARVMHLKENTVSNALRRGAGRGWFLKARLGRVFDAVDRYVTSDAGVEELHRRFGWEVFWWHTPGDVQSLARRLEVLEMAYMYLPDFWQSNLVSRPTVHVYAEMPDTTLTGEPTSRTELVEHNWFKARLFNLHWMKTGPFEAIATYSNGYSSSGYSDGFLFLPVLWRGSFQKPEDIAGVNRAMDQVLVDDERFSTLKQDQMRECRAGMVVFCPDRVSAAMVQRNWSENISSQERNTTPAIIDAQGQVVRAMDPPNSCWRTFCLPPLAAPPKDNSPPVKVPNTKPYLSVNGRRPWSAFRNVDGSPGMTLDQAAEFLGVKPEVAGKLVEPMVKAKVLMVKVGGQYLEVSGRGLLADSQRKTRTRIKRRFGVYASPGGKYRRAQRLHNQGQAQAILELRRHGFAAFPACGITINYWHQGLLVRVVPDAFVVLPPGVLVAIEYERSATSPQEVETKAQKYKRLADIGHPLGVLFITETEEAAKNLAILRCRYLLATTLEAVKHGPHGRAIMQERDVSEGADSGCWWYWYSDRDAPSSSVPIDLWSQIYARNNKNVTWRLPLDRPWRLLPRPPWG